MNNSERETGSRSARVKQGDAAGGSIRDRVGLAVSGLDSASAVASVIAAEKAGVRQVWSTQIAIAPDTITMFAAAAMQTSEVRLGTSIVPTYPRHPIVLAHQALALHDLAPGRFRLGIGTSHRPTIEGMYGLPMPSPLEHLKEYVQVLRAMVDEGKVDHEGRFFKVKVELPRPSNTPILISALRVGAFRLAGEISDGAISWVCPARYLVDQALPALQEGARAVGRPAPPLVAHVPVALTGDRQAVRESARRNLGRYGRLPFYAAMFADAGYPVGPDGTLSDDLIDNLVVSGDEGAIAARFRELLSAGLDELLVLLVPLADPGEEQARLARLIGGL